MAAHIDNVIINNIVTPIALSNLDKLIFIVFYFRIRIYK